MRCHVVLVITSWLATQTQAYAPILWTKLPAKKLVITPKGFSGNLKDLPPPQQLTLMEPPDMMSPKTIPYFTIQPDKTITVETSLCIEAEGDKSGDAVRINKCTGNPSQKWDWIPNGHGQNMIQLMNTNKCLDVRDDGASAGGATIQLQDCKSRVMDAWKFEDPIPTPTRDAPQSFDFSDMRHVMFTLIALVGVGSLALHRRFWSQRAQRTMVSSVDQGSVCLSVPLSALGDSATSGERNTHAGRAHISMSSVDSNASNGEPKRVYSIADQVRRFERAKEENNERYLNISSVYNSENMKGKKVLVIGASKGLGLEIIRQLVEDGAEPIATCRKMTAELMAVGASKAQIIENVEVTSTESLKGMAKSIEGPLDYVIFNAGIFPNVVDNLDSIQPEEAINQFTICGFGPVRCVSVLKGAGLLKGAKVAVISSQAGSAEWRFTQNKDKGGDYGHHMCRAATNIGCTLMSEELKAEEVPIVILHPGFNRTSMTAKYSEIWDLEGAVPPGDGAKRVLYETALISMETSGQFINCEDGLRIPW